jgi:hypothetical protein
MSENDFINKLASEHSKVERSPSTGSRFFKWLLICLFSLSIGISTLGLREDWTTLFNSPILLIQNLFIFISFIMSGLVAIKLSTPGAIKGKRGKTFIYLVISIWSLILICLGLFNGAEISNFTKVGFSCIKDIIIIGIIPGMALFFFILQGVLLKRSLASFLAMLSAFGLGAFGVQFTCHNDDPIHIFMWHFLPLILLSFLGMLIGKKVVKKL